MILFVKKHSILNNFYNSNKLVVCVYLPQASDVQRVKGTELEYDNGHRYPLFRPVKKNITSKLFASVQK